MIRKPLILTIVIFSIGVCFNAFAGEWTTEKAIGCTFYNPYPAKDETAVWLGSCINNKAQGLGVLIYYVKGRLSEKLILEMKKGYSSNSEYKVGVVKKSSYDKFIAHKYDVNDNYKLLGGTHFFKGELSPKILVYSHKLRLKNFKGIMDDDGNLSGYFLLEGFKLKKEYYNNYGYLKDRSGRDKYKRLVSSDKSKYKKHAEIGKKYGEVATQLLSKFSKYKLKDVFNSMHAYSRKHNKRRGLKEIVKLLDGDESIKKHHLILYKKAKSELARLDNRKSNHKKIQKLLVRMGYDVGSIDGIVGNSTKSAISAFQKLAGLKTTGTITKTLLSQLELYLKKNERKTKKIHSQLTYMGYLDLKFKGGEHRILKKAINSFYKDNNIRKKLSYSDTLRKIKEVQTPVYSGKLADLLDKLQDKFASDNKVSFINKDCKLIFDFIKKENSIYVDYPTSYTIDKNGTHKDSISFYFSKGSNRFGGKGSGSEKSIYYYNTGSYDVSVRNKWIVAVEKILNRVEEQCVKENLLSRTQRNINLKLTKEKTRENLNYEPKHYLDDIMGYINSGGSSSSASETLKNSSSTYVCYQDCVSSDGSVNSIDIQVFANNSSAAGSMAAKKRDKACRSRGYKRASSLNLSSLSPYVNIPVAYKI